MSIPSSLPASSNSVAPSAQHGTDAAKGAGEKKGDVNVQARQQLNAGILKASLEVSLKSGDQSTALLYRSAIDKINALLEPELGPDALQAAAKSDDWSPEATAGRIVSMSTAFFANYAEGHAGEPDDEVARKFVELIRGGFEQGFKEAKDILEGLGVLGGDIESGIMKTYELVHKGLDDFLAARLSKPEAETDGVSA